jgi:hypothetical protein
VAKMLALSFEGVNGARAFYTMHGLYKIGCSLKENRTRADVLIEAEIDDEFNKIAAASLLAAQAVGSVPDTLLREIADENAARAKRGEDSLKAVFVAGCEAIFLRSLHEPCAMMLDASRSWRMLNDAVNAGVAKSHTKDARAVRDVLNMLDAAPQAIAPAKE